MVRPNHEFFCLVALSPGLSNWVSPQQSHLMHTPPVCHTATKNYGPVNNQGIRHTLMKPHSSMHSSRDHTIQRKTQFQSFSLMNLIKILCTPSAVRTRSMANDKMQKG